MIADAKILVATPAAGGMVTAAYAQALFNIVAAFRDQRPDTRFELAMTAGTDLHVMRNYFAARFLENASLTHLLFIDADTIVSPRLVAKLIDFDKPFVGSLVPARSLKAARVAEAARRAPPDDELIGLALDYVAAEDLIPMDDSADRRYFLSKGFVRTKRIGTGATLVRREVFDVLRSRHEELIVVGSEYYQRMGISGPVLQCFAPLQSPDGTFFSEDISFCERWRGTGGEIWACVDERVSHIGPYSFTGRYLDRMQRSLFQTE